MPSANNLFFVPYDNEPGDVTGIVWDPTPTGTQTIGTTGTRWRPFAAYEEADFTLQAGVDVGVGTVFNGVDAGILIADGLGVAAASAGLIYIDALINSSSGGPRYLCFGATNGVHNAGSANIDFECQVKPSGGSANGFPRGTVGYPDETRLQFAVGWTPDGPSNLDIQTMINVDGTGWTSYASANPAITNWAIGLSSLSIGYDHSASARWCDMSLYRLAICNVYPNDITDVTNCRKWALDDGTPVAAATAQGIWNPLLDIYGGPSNILTNRGSASVTLVDVGTLS